MTGVQACYTSVLILYTINMIVNLLWWHFVSYVIGIVLNDDENVKIAVWGMEAAGTYTCQSSASNIMASLSFIAFSVKLSNPDANAIKLQYITNTNHNSNDRLPLRHFLSGQLFKRGSRSPSRATVSVISFSLMNLADIDCGRARWLVTSNIDDNHVKIVSREEAGFVQYCISD